ncbi:MAG: cell surface protein SprA [bacterium]
MAAHAAPGLALPSASGRGGDSILRPARFYSLTSDTTQLTLLVPPLPKEIERYEYDFETGLIRKTIAYRRVSLAPGEVYTPKEWIAKVASRSLVDTRRRAAIDALKRQSAARQGDLTKFEIPVKFPKAVSSLIGQGVNINVSGRESISFSGESNIPIKRRDNEIGGPRAFPDLDMRQQLQINLDGQIGDKINVQVQHDSESQTPLSNRIKLDYKGYEDEIVQKIEIGNTTLSLPGNQYVSFGGRQQGLFGAKVEGKAGKLDFTAIVSKQEGRTDRESFVGQSSERTQLISDYSYEKNRIFCITGDGGRRIYEPVDSIHVYLDDRNETNDLEAGVVVAQAFLDGNPSRPGVVGKYEELIRGLDYTLSDNLGILTMNRPVPDNHALAVYYVTRAGRRVGLRPANPAPAGPDSTVLKLIRPLNPSPGSADTSATETILRETWALQLRNVYDMHATGIQTEGFRMRILKRLPGQVDIDLQGSRTFLGVLGLDNLGIGGASEPDDRVDERHQNCRQNLPWTDIVLVDYVSGLIFFPGEQPFDPVPGQEIVDCRDDVSLEERNSGIYDKRYVDLKSTDQKYVIEVTYRSAGSSTLSLGKSNILEGSEVVRMGDQVLQRGEDYIITYEIGLIEFKNEDAKKPDARISVDFEYAPFLAQQQKSLFGLAGTYEFSPKAQLSSIWLFESSKTPYKRPRLGQEPSRALVGGLAGQWRSEASYLTDFTEKIPFIEVARGSNIAVSGEVATNIPNPNTRDNIYIDDMEGTEESSNLGNGRRQWTYMSLPRDPASNGLLAFEDRFRRIEWYNPEERARRSDLNPTLDDNEGDQFLTVLELAMKRGSLNNPGEASPNSWGGIMRHISDTGADYSRRKFIEIWINGPEDGRLHFDLGVLSEDAMWQNDVKPNGALDTEDRNRDGRLDDTGADDPSNDEDTGLDTLFNRFEVCELGDPDCNTADPTGDNWDYNDDEDQKNNYSQINGTEDNGFLDTEDLDGDGDVIRPDQESFFRYSVDLDTTVRPPEARGKPGTGWRLYRIPIRDKEGEPTYGTPRLDNGIKTARLWFSGIDSDSVTFQLASIEVVGNRWLEGPLLSGEQSDSSRVVPGYGLIADSLSTNVGEFTIRTIDNKTGEDYQSPPIDLRESRGVVEQEQSLVLDFKGLAPGHSGYALKDLFQDENYSRYAALNFWYQTRQEMGGDPWLFVRFGFDSLNFYEYRTPLVSGIGWQEVKLDLADLTRVKLTAGLDGTTADSVTLYRPDRPQPYVFSPVAGGEVAAIGSPTLTRVGVIEFGVMNRDTTSLGATTGEVWVNELRLINVLKDPGLAARIGISADFADFAGLNVNFSRVDDNFHSLGGTRTGNVNTDVRFGGSVALHKFVENSGLSLPFNWSWSKNKSLPELKSGSDIVLDDRNAERSETRDLNGSVSISRSKKSKNALMYHTIDAMNFNLSGNVRNSFSPTKVDTSDAYRMGFGYAFRPRSAKTYRVYRSLSVAYFPTSIGFSAAKDESRTTTTDTRVLAQALTAADSARATRDVDSRRSSSSFSVDGSPLTTSGITTSYSFVSSRDHARGDEIGFLPGVNWGLEVGRSQTASAKYVPSLPKVLQWIAPNLTYDTKYNEVIPFELERSIVTATGDSTRIRPKNVNSENRTALNLTISTTRLFGAAPPRRAEGTADSTGGPGVMSSALSSARAFGRRLQDVRGTFSITRGSAFDRVLERPGLAYQLGLNDEIDPETLDRVPGREDRFDRKRDLTGRFSSGVSIVPGVGVTADYSYTRSHQERSRNTQERRAVTWPRLNLNWGNVERIKLVQRYVESASLNTAYQISNEEAGASLDTPDRKTTRKEWAPLFAIAATFPNTLRANLTGNRSTSISESFLGASTRAEGSQSSYRLGFEYRVQTARKVSMPILGRGEPTAFTSELTMGLDFNLQSDKDIVKGRGEIGDNVQSNTRTWNITPKANYTFSKNVTGSMDARYGQTNNRKNESLSRRTIGVSVSAALKF